MKIGTTSFSFRYWLLDEATAPSLDTIVRQTRGLGLDRLQICENARPMSLDESAWDGLVARAADMGLEVQLGCKTLTGATMARHLRRAARTPARLLRVVLEEDDAHHGTAPTREAIDRLLADVWPAVRETGVRLAIENHFDIPSRVLAEAVRPYPADLIGFCIDSANSLRNFETAEDVYRLLGDRAFCYHLKDFKVDGHMLGFMVGGAPLGRGHLDLDACLDQMFQRHPEPMIFIENWVPATGDRKRDVAADEAWLRSSMDVLRARLAARVASPSGLRA